MGEFIQWALIGLLIVSYWQLHYRLVLQRRLTDFLRDRVKRLEDGNDQS